MSDKLLVRGRWIITDAHSEVTQGAALLIAAGRVLEIGDWKQLRREHDSARVVGNARSATIPGLVNAHHHGHAVSGILHGVSDDLLESWILAWHGMRALVPRLRAWYGAWQQPQLRPWITYGAQC